MFSLIYYGLYPLSRYLTSRPSEESEKGLPPAAVHGTAVWDGGAVATQSQTTLPDQRLGPCGGSKGGTKERMKEQSPVTEDDVRPDTDKEQPMAVLRGETKNDAKMSQVQSTVKEEEDEEEEEEMRETQQRDKALDKGDTEIDDGVFYEKQNTEDEAVINTEDINPEQALVAQLESLQTEDGIQVTSCPAQEKTEIPNIEESVTPAEPNRQETTPSVQGQIQTPRAEELVNEAEAEGTECWDEYSLLNVDEMHGGASSPDLVFASLLANTQNLTFNGQYDTQTGWHFPPAGPGPADGVQCPPWQIPATSYYPPEPTVPFEVMWRAWEEMDESATAAEPAPTPVPSARASMDFTVMSYNVLAQDLLEANQELYTHCPLEVLDWSYRCSLLLQEIEQWAPDILCLQEVQENHYHEQLYPVLTLMGYTCVYKRRTGAKTDGCATCYRSSCFSEVSVTPLEFFRPDTELLDRHNVGIVLLLRPVVIRGSEVEAKGPHLCVANTHLLFNPRRGDVKLAQLAVMLAEIHNGVESCEAEGEHCDVILCGDFNSVPFSPLYQLITTGELYFQGLPAWRVSGQEDLSHKDHCYRLFAPLWPSCLGINDNCQYTTVEETYKSQSRVSGMRQYSHDFLLQLRYCPVAYVRPPDLQQIPGVTDNMPDASKRNQPHVRSFRHTVRHRLDLESVYKHILPGSGNSEVTTLNSEMGATVDYIFYSPKRISPSDQKAGGDFVSRGLKLTSCLSLLSEDVLWSMNGLPNHIFPSDHLSLLAKFQLDLNAA